LATSILLVMAFTSFAAGIVHVNQIGFGTTAQKLAVYVGDNPGTITLKSVDGGAESHTITPGQQGQWTHSYSGEYSRILDFSSVQAYGDYAFFEDNTKISPVFKIGISYDELIKGALKFFYYHRADLDIAEPYAAADFTRVAGHSGLQAEIYNANVAGTGSYITSYRGWYDAGDYGRYIVNSGISTYTLLALYEKYAEKIPALNIPSDPEIQALPDLLAEIKWNLDWMLSMQDAADGGVYHKMTGINFSSDDVLPGDDDALPLVVVWKTTAATLNFAAVMAVASRIYSSYDNVYADKMLNAAKHAWDWAKKNPKVFLKDPTKTGTYQDNDVKDEFFFAAATLATVVGSTEQKEFLDTMANRKSYYADIATWQNVGSLGTLEIVRNRDKFSSNVYSAAVSVLNTSSDNYLSNNNTYGLPFGDIFWWGSNAAAANIAIQLLETWELKEEGKYKDAAQSILDYFLGRNPLAQSYVTGFGNKLAVNPHDRLSTSHGKTIPGQLVGGPANSGCTGSSSYKANLATKYEDKHDCYGYNEIAINWNAPLAYLLVALSEESGEKDGEEDGEEDNEEDNEEEVIEPIIASVPKVNALKAWIQNGTLHLSGLTAGKTWSVYTVSGALVHRGVANSTEANLHLNASGIYFVKSNGQVLRLLNN